MTGLGFLLLIVLCSTVSHSHRIKGKAHRRMIGGQKVTDWKAWQSTVYINFLHKKPLWKTCGGILVSKEWVMTAAHCIEGIFGKPEYLSLGIGRTTRIQTPGQHNFSVSQIVVHPNFVTPDKRKGPGDVSIDYDIVLLKLSKPVPAQFSFISLPNEKDDISQDPNFKCQSAGWGKTETVVKPKEVFKNKYSVSDKLNSIDVKLITKQECITRDKIKESDGNFYGVKKDMARIVCADPAAAGNQSGCLGDSGAPLVCEKNGVRTIQGVLAGGDVLCRFNKLSMYFSQVSKYVSWIKSIIGA